MKICVYAICKNESQFVERWMNSMCEADGIYVLDTGSSDDTVELLQSRGAQVRVETISPWRFDTARNRSLELVPADADICVCTDLDELFHPGWRKALEKAWFPEAGQARYRYTWSFRPDGSEGVVFWYEKIHRRHGYRWHHPVHEVLQWAGPGQPGPMVTVAGVQLDHHPDPTKSRGQYLPLLELSVREAPEDDRNVHYLGREYLFYGRWDDCIATLEHHLSMPTATWADERAASMRYIGQAFLQKREENTARDWFFRAIAQAPHLREPWMEMAQLLYQQKNWEGVLYFTGQALTIASRPETYICEADAWGPLPHDLRCQAYFHTGRSFQALEEAQKALALSPTDARLAGNVAILRQIRHIPL